MTTPTPRTVRVRVAVAVNAKGDRYSEIVHEALGDDYALNSVGRVVAIVGGGPVCASIIEADIPLPPSPETVAGEVG